MKLKLLISALLMAVTGVASAGRGYSPDGLINHADQVNNLIRAEANNLSRDQVISIRQSLRDIENTIRNGSNRDPGDGGGRGGNLLVRGDVEGVDFTLQAYSLDELNDRCMSTVRDARITQADDIRVSVNLSPLKPLRNSSSYWKGTASICNVIMQEVRATGVEHTGSMTVFTGDVEGLEFVIKGRDLVDATLKCETFISNSNISQADDINVAVNHRPMRALRNSSSYWKGRIEICQQIVGANRYR
jgi:hypothetical protein